MAAARNLDWGLVAVVDGGGCHGHLKVLELAGAAEQDVRSFGQFHLESRSCLCMSEGVCGGGGCHAREEK